MNSEPRSRPQFSPNRAQQISPAARAKSALNQANSGQQNQPRSGRKLKLSASSAQRPQKLQISTTTGIAMSPATRGKLAPQEAQIYPRVGIKSICDSGLPISPAAGSKISPSADPRSPLQRARHQPAVWVNFAKH